MVQVKEQFERILITTATVELISVRIKKVNNFYNARDNKWYIERDCLR
jgi:hypothetical protein